MRLLTKTFIFYITLVLCILVLGGIISYFLVNHIFYKQVDEGLITEKEIIAEEIENNENIPDYSSRFGHQIEVLLLNRKTLPQFFLKDTIISANDSSENYRYLYFSSNRSHGRSYVIKIFHPLSETHDLIEGILLVIMLLFLCLFLALIGINYYISRKIWLPFYHTIRELNLYNINDKNALSLSDTGVYEFNILNQALMNMSEKILTDYINMKEFTENASHEIQTPLAIIKSKIEILIQSGQWDSEQMDALQTMNDSVNRLAKLNSGLILLSKIDNRQFSITQQVNIIPVFNKILDQFEDLIALKNLQVRKNLEPVFNLALNNELSEILVSNLLSNAIKHNIDGGFIEIEQDDNCLIIRNSGIPLSIPEKELFNRFVKNEKTSRSLGLGLAILKKILEQYHIGYSYTSINTIHTFKLWKNKNTEEPHFRTKF